MACIHKQYNEVQNGCYCDCLNKLYCNQGRHCNFYQSDKRYKHGLTVESNGMIYKTVVDMIFKPVERIKPKPKPRKSKTITIRDNSGLNYQFK